MVCRTQLLLLCVNNALLESLLVNLHHSWLWLWIFFQDWVASFWTITSKHRIPLTIIWWNLLATGSAVFLFYEPLGNALCMFWMQLEYLCIADVVSIVTASRRHLLSHHILNIPCTPERKLAISGRIPQHPHRGLCPWIFIEGFL